MKKIFLFVFASHMLPLELYACLDDKVIDREIVTCDGGTLSVEKLKETQIAGALGDPEAAFRVNRHYVGLGDFKSAARWLTIAAENGDGEAAYMIAETSAASSDIGIRCRALYWATIAEKKGIKGAAALKKQTQVGCPKD